MTECIAAQNLSTILSINKEKKIGEKTKGKGRYTLKFSQLEKIPG